MEKKLIIMARIVSILSTPFYIPLFALILLFWLSYLNMFPLQQRIHILCIVYLFTILLPTVLIKIYRGYNGWKAFQLGTKERRMVPYIISIACYFGCYYLFNYMRLPHFITTIVIAALLIQLVCAFINIWWKVSTHTAGIGGLTGGLVVSSLLFSFNLLGWFSVALLVGGLVGTSRMILRQHTLSQVVVGYLLGMVLTMISIIYI